MQWIKSIIAIPFPSLMVDFCTSAVDCVGELEKISIGFVDRRISDYLDAVCMCNQ